MAEGLPGIQRAEILSLCDEVDYLSNQLNDLCRRAMGSSPKVQEIAKYVFIRISLRWRVFDTSRVNCDIM